LCEPELIVLDEPTVGLDPVAAREVLAMLKESMKSRTALLCTHNLAEAEELCDTVVILRDGRVVLDDTIDALKKRAPMHVSLRARQGPAAIVEALASLNLMSLEASVDQERATMLVSDPEATLPDVLRALIHKGLDVFECVATPPTLEELFIRAVQEHDKP
jgi:ABC-2 type transport system ATP-binding protein